jgi:hypothetical protein
VTTHQVQLTGFRCLTWREPTDLPRSDDKRM